MNSTLSSGVLGEVLNELKDRGVPVRVECDGSLNVDGIYMGCSVLIREREEGKVEVVTSKGKVSELKSFQDLVDLNYRWFKDSSKDDYPDTLWLEILFDYGYVKKEITTVVVYK
ncbi:MULTISPECIES: hypothetical protein [Bacillus]|uniref:hypothetical protein n=1 Tax=Bacillus TaxID=1386 RepID=UPI000E46F56D|nr:MULTISPECIES: hypothetical protein [Bacillus subtilis group]MBT3123198.1 hypothetical protein [Bacillus inaquosorum]MCB4340532.1 hypothetical protein [Bacillus subtilis]MCB5337347.1 hypothetical protein [Bacillus amyloliquefaciens]MCF7615385.1 hypothetical protein [Bacillus subtilis]MCL9628304.1 hypothetical protein [Bacillus subtilis]